MKYNNILDYSKVLNNGTVYGELNPSNALINIIISNKRY